MSLLTISFVFHDSYVVRNDIFLKPSISIRSRDLFNPLISSLDLSCVMFHLKPSLRNIANYGAINDPSFLLSSRRKQFSSLR